MEDILEELKPIVFSKSGDNSWEIYAEFIDSLTTFLARNPNTQHLVTEIETLLTNENNSDMRNVVEKLSNNDKLIEAIAKYFKELFPMNVIDREFNKDHAEATQSFRLGKESLSRKEYVNAMNYYSKAIRFAEQKTSDNLLSTLYWHRAIVFYKSKQYYDCVKDIQLLFRHFNNSLSMDEVIKLLAHAASHLADCDDHELLDYVITVCAHTNIAKEVMHDLLSPIMKNKNKCAKTAKTQSLDDESINSPEEMVSLPFDFDLKKHEKNPSIEGASKKLTLSLINDTKYRGYRAKTDIFDGERVFVEKPFAIHYFRFTYDTHCGNCLKRLYSEVSTDCSIDSHSSSLESSAHNRPESLENIYMQYCSFVPCKTCNKFIFCNRKCLNEAYEKFHQRECKGNLFAMENQMGIGYLVARLICAVEDLDIYSESNTINKLKDKNDELPNILKGDYGDILKLMNHNNEHDNRSKICYILTAFFLDYCFEEMVFPFQLTRSFKQDRLGFKLLIIHHLQQLSTNFMTIYEQKFVKDDLSQSKELPIGIGIYPNMALLNHSCEPNLIPIFTGCKVVLKSAKNIPAGQEVCISYGPTYYNFSYKKRQKWLKDQYFFKCQCEACFERKESHKYAFLCNVCNGPAMLEYRDEPQLKPYLLCRYGHEIEDLQPILAKIKKAIGHREIGDHFFDQGVHKNNSNDIVAALVSFYNADLQFTDTLYRLNYVCINLKSKMIECYLKMGQYERAAIYSKQIIDSYKRYPKHRELLMPNILEHVRLIRITMLSIEELELSDSKSGSIKGDEKSRSGINEDEEKEAEVKDAEPEITAKADAYYGQEINNDTKTATDAVEAILHESSPSDSTVSQEESVLAKIDDHDLKQKMLKLYEYYGEIINARNFCLNYRDILPQNLEEFLETTLDTINTDEYYSDLISKIFE